MEVLIGILILFPITILFLTSLINSLFGPKLNKKIVPENYPKVSVLIPARNEEKNISNSLESMMEQDYPDMEIIVLDDSSTDSTSQIVSKLQQEDRRIRLIKGKELPEGWLGKNWACHQLAQEAKGEILIFTDADNFYKPYAVSNTVGRMQRHGLDFLSAFPQQVTVSFFERLIVPLIDMIIYSFFILWSSYYIKWNIFAAANGQWIAVKKEAYFSTGGHKKLRKKIVEDTAMSRLFKKNDYRTLTTAGTGVIFGRMYTSLDEIWQGLTKNLFSLMSGSVFGFIIFFTALTLSSILPYFFFLFDGLQPYLIAALALNLLWRWVLCFNFRHTFFDTVVLHPVSILFLLAIWINSLIQSKFGIIKWKDREINLQEFNKIADEKTKI